MIKIFPGKQARLVNPALKGRGGKNFRSQQYFCETERRTLPESQGLFGLYTNQSLYEVRNRFLKVYIKNKN